MKVMRSATFALTGTLAAMLASCSTAPDKFASADTDKSGAITPTEFDTFMKQTVFEKIDGDGDGSITMAEWTVINPKGTSAKFKRADGNGDGGITRPEGDAAFDRKGTLTKLFKVIDSDRDGSISRPEAEAFRAAISPKS